MERLSGLDATFLYVETKTMHMQVSMLVVLDPKGSAAGYDHARLERLIEVRARETPKLTRRLLDVPLEVHHPVWVEDPDFDPIHHIKRVACPEPGGVAELSELCGRINSTPLDRTRPLWEIWIIEGLADGKVAILAKVHHALTDGVAGATLLANMFSLSPELPKVELTAQAKRAPQTLPTGLELLRDAVVDRFNASKQIGRIFQRTSQALQTIQSHRKDGEHATGATPLLDVPRTVFNAPITAKRSTAFARVRLEDVKLIRKAYSVTVNDVVLALCAGALRRYLEAKGDLPLAPLVAACPIALRADGASHGSNHVSAMFTSLATNLEDPVERLLAIHHTSRGAKEEHNAFGGATMGDWAELASPALFAAGTRMYTKYKLSNLHRPFHNVMISNVPGPPIPLYLDGLKVVATYPMGPVMEGAGLNITVMSYMDQVDFGFLAASVLVPDVWNIADAILPSLEELKSRALATTSVRPSV